MKNSDIDSKGYKGNINLKRINQEIDWTPELVQEYVKCSEDPVYFIETHMKIINVNEGLVNFNLYDYQKQMIRGFQDNRFNIITTARQAVKALPLDTKIPSPSGWKTMGDLKVGDYVFSDEGVPIKISAISDIFNNHDCYKLYFDDGSTVIADAEHLWEVRKQGINKTPVVLTTQEMFNQSVTFIDSRNKEVSKFSIKVSDPVQYPTKKVKIDPYTLGVWLGDGSSADGRLTCIFDDLLEYKKHIPYNFSESHRKENDGIYFGTMYNLYTDLKEYKLLKNKHIPTDYLLNNIENRLELLRGLMDTDGWVEKNGQNCISLSYSKYPQLIEDVYELLCSLGFKVFRKEYKKTNSARLYFQCPKSKFKIFKLSRKLDKQREEIKVSSYINSRFIRKIEKVESVPTKCIVVESDNHLFLCSKHFIPTHNSTTTCGFILWYIIFHSEKTVALLANKGDTAREILGKIQLAYQHLPKWLQQGVTEWNKGSFELENNSRVIAAATSSSAIRGYSINLLFIDEAAFIEGWDEFFTSVYPTISSGDETKIVLVSTPNGLNHFYSIWVNAVQKRNQYNFMKVMWQDVPNRNDKWKDETLAAMNFDIEKFQQEYECEFLGSSGTLIAGWKLKELVHMNPVSDKEGLTQYKQAEKEHAYITVCDVSRGKGLDYSAFQVLDVTSMPYQQVCVYRNNAISPVDYASIIHGVAKGYNNAAVLVEINDIGEQVSHSLHYDLGYDNILFTENAGRSGKRITGGFGKGEIDKGVRTTKIVKSVGCSILKLLIEQNQLIINDFNTINELSTFSKKGKSYEAEHNKHDDLVMCLVLFAWLSDQDYFKEYTDINTLMSLIEKTEEDIEQDLAPFGFIFDGREDFYDESFEDINPDAWMFNDSLKIDF